MVESPIPNKPHKHVVVDSDLKSHEGFISPFYHLLRVNSTYRFLWLAGVISWFGAWFYEIGLITLLQFITEDNANQTFIISAFLAMRRVVPALSYPLAGVVADKFDRRVVMMICDMALSLIVLGYMTIFVPQQLWQLFAIQIIQLVFETFFRPAEAATLPTVVSRNDLLVANTLDGMTYSIMMFVGASLGGAVTAAIGYHLNFLITAAGYILACLSVAKVVYSMDGNLSVLTRIFKCCRRNTSNTGHVLLQQDEEEADEETGSRTSEVVDDIEFDGKNPQKQQPSSLSNDTTGEEETEAVKPVVAAPVGFIAMAKDAISYVWTNRDILWLTCAKCMSNVALTGFDVINIRLIKAEFSLGFENGAFGLGLMFAMGAIGVLVGPVIARRLSDGSNVSMRRWLMGCFITTACCYALNSWAPHAAVFYLVAIPSQGIEAILFAFIHTLVQQETKNAYRGRVSALSLSIRVFVAALGAMCVGLLSDVLGLSLRQCGWVFTAFSVWVAIFWGAIYYPRFRKGIIVIPLGDLEDAAIATSDVELLPNIQISDENDDLIEQHLLLRPMPAEGSSFMEETYNTPLVTGKQTDLRSRTPKTTPVQALGIVPVLTSLQSSDSPISP